MPIDARSGFVASLANLTLLLATPRAFADEDLFIGTWVLNVAKSQGSKSVVPDSATMVISDLGSGKYKSVTTNVLAGGVTSRTEITFATDGKDYAMVMTPSVANTPPVTESIERVNATTYKVTLKLAGQVMATALEQVSANGKTLTATATGVGQFAAGFTSVQVFDRE